MSALLVNPWVYDFACYDLFNKPTGLLELGALLKTNNFRVELIDCMDRFDPAMTAFLGADAPKYQKAPCGNYYSEETEKPSIFRDVPRKYKRHGMPERLFRSFLKKIAPPDIILVTSGMTYWYRGVFEAIKILKEEFPQVPVLLGGIYAALCNDHARKHSGADIVFKGTGLKEAAKLISTVAGRGIEASSGYYTPAYELYPKAEYITLRTSSGCPYRCSYCAWYLLDPLFSQNAPAAVLEEIEGLMEATGAKDIAFYDEALLYNPERHIIPILNGIKARGIGARLHTPNGLHARFLTEEMARLLKECDFAEPRLGFESSSASRQASTGGKVTSEELKRAVMYLKEAGYRNDEIGVYLLIGLPDQSYEEAEESLLFVNSLGARVHLEEYSPVPGTPYYEMSGIPKDADPLMHNNSVFPLYDSRRFAEFQKLKDLNQRLNKGLRCSIIKH